MLDWPSMCIHQHLPEHIIRQFSDRVDWNLISEYQNLCEDFIHEFEDKVNWKLILKNQDLVHRDIVYELLESN